MHFHLLMPFVTQFAHEAIANFFKGLTSTYKIHNIETLTNWHYTEEEMARFRIETDAAIPIYFDHKVANSFGSFPQIYLQGLYYHNNEAKYYGSLFEKDPSREVIEKFAKSLQS